MFERKLHPDMTPMTLIEMIDELEKAIDYEGTPETVTVPTNVTWDMGWMLNKLRKCHAAGFISDSGEARKVLGKFKYTNDGAIACEEGEAFCVADPYGDGPKVYKCRRSGNPTDYGCWWQIDDCDSDSVIVLSVWSTREAAEAARGEK
jgi:hypothetical protein